MGQNLSAPSRGRRKSFRKLRTAFPQRSASYQHPLSATFNVPDVDSKVEQLNVNAASEEDLMTLPGITRAIAQSIVEHRRVIGRFRKVEDLALVSGIGAEKLDKIRPEICVSRRAASSRAQSLDSLKSTDSSRGGGLKSPQRLVDVNKANVFDLQCVHGISQELAANIVHYRDKKGPFKSLDGLLKVRGVDPIRLGSIRSNITINPMEVPIDPLLDNTHDALSPTVTLHTPKHRKSLSVPMKFPLNGFSKAPINDIFELLSAYSYRPIVEEDFKYERNGGKAVRIATWNLDRFCLQKAENLGFREVVCRTILENRLSVLAIQDIRDISALKLICDELNKPTLHRVVEWKENSHEWNYCLADVSTMFLNNSACVGFIYDTNSGGIPIQFISIKEIHQSNGGNGRKSAHALAKFHIGDIDVSMLNVYALESSDENVNLSAEELQTSFEKDDVIVVLGDLTEFRKQIDTLISASEFLNIVPVSTNTSSMSINPHYNTYRYTDNILLGGTAKLQYTGVSGVVRQGLTHMAIPRGWAWGGPASEHCPVWCELFVRRVTKEGGLKKMETSQGTEIKVVNGVKSYNTKQKGSSATTNGNCASVKAI